MHNTAQERTGDNAPMKPVRGPGPALLPGIEGFFVLTAAGTLGRYQSDGRFVEEPAISARLGDATAALLRRYRSGDVERLAIALVIRKTPDKPWQGASLTFSDGALREIYGTGDDHAAPLTPFQKRNKVKSIYRGMELILDTRKASRPDLPRFCPVLVAPEYDHDELSRRYGVADIDTVNSLEVLDLMDPLSPEQQRHPTLSQLVVDMSRSKITPEMRSGPELKVVDNAGGASPGSPDDGPASFADPWGDKMVDNAGSVTPGTPEDGPPSFTDPWGEEEEQRIAAFSDGDPVPYWLLASFSPFNELNDVQRQFIARGHTVTRKAAGATLIERGSTDDVTCYLIEGTLQLEAFDGRTMQIVSGTRRAHLPVSQLRPHAYTVKAATDAMVVFVSQDMVREINRIATTYKSRPSIEVTEEGPGSAGIDYEPGPGRH